MQLKNYLLILIIFAGGSILFTSCKKANKEGKYVPSNASLVIHVNAKSVTEKLPWSEIQKQNYFQAINADTATTAFMRSIMANPENSGISLEDDLLMFMVNDATGGYFVIEGNIKDKSKFAAMQAEMKTGDAVTKSGDWDVKTGTRTLTAWNNDRFIALSDVPEMKQGPKMNVNDPEADSSIALVQPPVTYRDLGAVLTSLTNLKEDNSLAKNEQFTDLMKTSGDLHAWINIEQLTGNMPSMPAMAMINLNAIYKGSIMAATVNFDAGKINIDAKSYASKEMTAIWKKYSGSTVNETMVKQIPMENIAAFFALNFKPEGVKEFLKLAGLDGLINMGSGMLGFNLDEFISANKGDILLAVGDLAKDSAYKNSAKYLFSASIGNRENFTKIVSAGKKFGEQQMATSGKLPELFYNLDDKYFTLSNSQQYADGYIQGKHSTMPAFFSDISGKPAAGYVNFQYIMTSLQNRAFVDSLDKVSLEASLKTWDHMIFSGGDMDGDATKQHAEIILVNKTENSLRQLNSYAGVMSGIIRERELQNKINPKDTTVVVQVP